MGRANRVKEPTAEELAQEQEDRLAAAGDLNAWFESLPRGYDLSVKWEMDRDERAKAEAAATKRRAS